MTNNIDVQFKDLTAYKKIPTYSKEEIDEKYKNGEKRLVTEQGRYPLDSLDGILQKSIKLNPDYQRSFVWSEVQKSRLIESFIMNIPVPPVFLYEIEFASYEVMDGRQRLTTIRDFYNNKFSLVGLEVWAELNGMKYSELPSNIKLGIDRRYISTIVILKETAKTHVEERELKQYVFERLNTGGTKLTDQEIRNAILPGKMNEFCKRLALENSQFHEIFNIIKIDYNSRISEGGEYLEEKYIRMEDVELVLRFFAYRQLNSNPMNTVKSILDVYLNEANNQIIDDHQYEYLEELFNKTLSLVNSLFGDKSYRMYTQKSNSKTFTWNKVPTKLLYDPINIVLCEYIEKKIDIKIKPGINLIKELEELFKSNYEIFNGRNNLKSHVLQRVGILKSFFNEVLLFEGK